MLVPRSRTSVGRATLTIVLSRTITRRLTQRTARVSQRREWMRWAPERGVMGTPAWGESLFGVPGVTLLLQCNLQLCYNSVNPMPKESSTSGVAGGARRGRIGRDGETHRRHRRRDP